MHCEHKVLQVQFAFGPLYFSPVCLLWIDDVLPHKAEKKITHNPQHKGLSSWKNYGSVNRNRNETPMGAEGDQKEN